MQSTQPKLVKPLTRDGHALSLRSANQKFGVQYTCCVKYIEQLDAIAAGEFKNPNGEARNAAVTLTSLGSDRQRKQSSGRCAALWRVR